MKKQCSACNKWLQLDTFLKCNIPVSVLPIPVHLCVNGKMSNPSEFAYNDLTWPGFGVEK